jgi:hypothetical protein
MTTYSSSADVYALIGRSRIGGIRNSPDRRLNKQTQRGREVDMSKNNLHVYIGAIIQEYMFI